MNDFARRIRFVPKIDGDEWADQVARHAWTKYREILEGRFSDLGKCFEGYFTDRKDAPFVIPLNAHVPVLLSQAFGSIGRNAMERGTIANLHLDHFTQLLDDATDKPEMASGPLLHLSHQLLVDAISQFTQGNKSPQRVKKLVLGYIDQGMAAERSLWRHHGSVECYSDNEYALIGHRGGLMRCVAAFLADQSENWEPLQAVEEALEAAALGVQLVDDLFDWQDDFRRGIFTPILTAAILDGSYTVTGDRDEIALVKALIGSTGVKEILERASASFRHAQLLFAMTGAAPLSSIADRLHVNLEQIRGYLIECGSNRVQLVDPDDFTDGLRKASDTRLMH